MKKKILATVMASIMAISLVACSAGDRAGNTGESSNAGDSGNTGESSNTGDSSNAGDSSNTGETSDTGAGSSSADTTTLSILSDVWAAYGENEKFYAMGGDATNPVDNAPGLYSLEDQEALQALLLVPADAAGMIDEAASLIHSMNANNFTGAAFHLTDGANTETFADTMKDSILNNQWMCGSPDQYVIYSLQDEYVVVAFGTMDIMKVFKEKFAAVHGEDVRVLADDKVAW